MNVVAHVTGEYDKIMDWSAEMAVDQAEYIADLTFDADHDQIIDQLHVIMQTESGEIYGDYIFRREDNEKWRKEQWKIKRHNSSSRN